jgi:pentatricopeptide repeat protein
MLATLVTITRELKLATSACAHLLTAMLLQQQGIGTTAITHNSMLNAYAKGAQHIKAEALLSSMEAQGIARSVKAYNCVIAANAAAGRWQRAVYWLQELPRRCVLYAVALQCVIQRALAVV